MDVLTFAMACSLHFALPSPHSAAWHQSCVQPAISFDSTDSGSAGDSWGRFIAEASARFSVPQGWIRAVMQAESGGRAFLNGMPITSQAGAIGLMQVMPETYNELKHRYGFGDDPSDPHDNILAGAAYIREMYDRYGSPGFLAAYNAGPQRLGAYLTEARPLPGETRHYIAQVAPDIADTPVVVTSERHAVPLRPQPPAPSDLTKIRRRDVADTAPRHDGGPLFFILKKPLAAPPDQR